MEIANRCFDVQFANNIDNTDKLKLYCRGMYSTLLVDPIAVSGP